MQANRRIEAYILIRQTMQHVWETAESLYTRNSEITFIFDKLNVAKKTSEAKNVHSKL